MARGIEAQTRDFQHVMVRLLKKYQFRDRNETVAYGLSVSQAYALRSLYELGPLTMGALAEDLHLTVSSTTRLVDSIVNAGHAERVQSDSDRRVWRAGLTTPGRATWRKLERELLGIDERVLRTLAPGERESIIRAIRLLADATESWRRAKRKSPPA